MTYWGIDCLLFGVRCIGYVVPVSSIELQW